MYFFRDSELLATRNTETWKLVYYVTILKSTIMSKFNQVLAHEHDDL